MTPFVEDIVIHRGASFEARGWVLTDDDGQPLRTTAGLEVLAPVKRWRGAAVTVAWLPCSVQAHTFPGQYGDLPVAVVQLDEMTAEQTSALGFERGVFSVTVNGDYRGGGRVAAPRVGA